MIPDAPSTSLPLLALALLLAPLVKCELCLNSSCRLPDCYCPGREGPLPPEHTPQIVLLTFDDYVNDHMMQYFKELFNGQRTNPNGCTIAATFYVSNKGGTDYSLVNELYRMGHEIGDHSVSHRMPHSWWGNATRKEWQQEMVNQLNNLVNRGRVPRSQVRGARSPFLELGEDRQFSMLYDLQFRYDSTFMTGPYSEDPSEPYSPAWPFTLDFFISPSEFCDNDNCPTSQYPGMWEVPLNRWMGLDHQACSMMDACASQGTTKVETLDYMWNNFHRHYIGNRAPFGIFLHSVWFDGGAHRLPAMMDFIDGLLKIPDVYFVTVNQALDWMQSPTNSSVIEDFAPWQQHCGTAVESAGVASTFPRGTLSYLGILATCISLGAYIQ